MTYVPCKYMQEIKLQVLITKNLIHYQTISNTNIYRYMKSFCTLTKNTFYSSVAVSKMAEEHQGSNSSETQGC